MKTRVEHTLWGDETVPVIGNLAAYAAVPGSGPKGETCKTCRHSYRQPGTAGTYWKCGLADNTRGAATDIRRTAPACLKWQAVQPEAGRE